MRTTSFALSASLVLAAPIHTAGTASTEALVVKAFVMMEAEDGKSANDSFEVWDTNCSLRPSRRAEHPRCSITAVSFVENEGRTFVYTWRHDSSAVREIRPGVFRIEMNGRLNQCSGLVVIMRLGGGGDTAESLEGDLRSGTQCQSRRTFTLDTASLARRISPIWNPASR